MKGGILVHIMKESIIGILEMEISGEYLSTNSNEESLEASGETVSDLNNKILPFNSNDDSLDINNYFSNKYIHICKELKVKIRKAVLHYERKIAVKSKLASIEKMC